MKSLFITLKNKMDTLNNILLDIQKTNVDHGRKAVDHRYILSDFTSYIFSGDNFTWNEGKC